MKKKVYLCVAAAMLSLLWPGCGKRQEASVFELGLEDGAAAVSSQDGGNLSVSREELEALLEEALDGLELNPVIQVTCNCTGEAQVQQVLAAPVQELPDDGKVNINTADAAALQTLNGIGESRAQAIIAYRESHGAFQKIEDIMQVDGIKEGVFRKIKDEVSVG